MEIFCPACKRLNESTAKVCVFCGAKIDLTAGSRQTAILPEKDLNAVMQEIEKTFVRRLIAPEKGIGIYSSNDPTPITIQDSPRFYLGRVNPGAPSEGLVDLTAYRGYEEGVSHKHALIRRTESGYEITDLGSTNGTWLNRKRLTPNQAYPLTNKAQIYLGGLCLYVVFK